MAAKTGNPHCQEQFHLASPPCNVDHQRVVAGLKWSFSHVLSARALSNIYTWISAKGFNLNFYIWSLKPIFPQTSIIASFSHFDPLSGFGFCLHGPLHIIRSKPTRFEAVIVCKCLLLKSEAPPCGITILSCASSTTNTAGLDFLIVQWWHRMDNFITL